MFQPDLGPPTPASFPGTGTGNLPQGLLATSLSPTGAQRNLFNPKPELSLLCSLHSHGPPGPGDLACFVSHLRCLTVPLMYQAH